MSKFKDHLDKYKGVYIGVAIGLGLVGITHLIMRRYSNICVGFADAAPVGFADGGENSIVNYQPGNSGVINNVSYISQNRQGPPSWVVRCLETGELYTSQRSASVELDIKQSDLSKHLNGLKPHANNLHFERICMAA